MSYDVEAHCYIFNCTHCGGFFRTRESRKRYCSDPCYSAAHPHRAPRYPRWTHQEDRILRQLAGEVPVKEIAARLGRTPEAVKSRAQSRKLSLICYGERHPGAKYSDALVEQARTLYDEGLTPKAIAEQLGIPYHAAQGFVTYRWRLGPPIERYF